MLQKVDNILWGADSYNDGAGMHRVFTAAQFIKGNMPFGQEPYNNPSLTDEEACHLAGFDRPKMKNKEGDYPDLKMRPIFTSYGSWVDNFLRNNINMVPFPPKINYYKENYKMVKTK